MLRVRDDQKKRRMCEHFPPANKARCCRGHRFPWERLPGEIFAQYVSPFLSIEEIFQLADNNEVAHQLLVRAQARKAWPKRLAAYLDYERDVRPLQTHSLGLALRLAAVLTGPYPDRVIDLALRGGPNVPLQVPRLAHSTLLALPGLTIQRLVLQQEQLTPRLILECLPHLRVRRLEIEGPFTRYPLRHLRDTIDPSVTASLEATGRALAHLLVYHTRSLASPYPGADYRTRPLPLLRTLERLVLRGCALQPLDPLPVGPRVERAFWPRLQSVVLERCDYGAAVLWALLEPIDAAYASADPRPDHEWTVPQLQRVRVAEYALSTALKFAADPALKLAGDWRCLVPRLDPSAPVGFGSALGLYAAHGSGLEHFYAANSLRPPLLTELELVELDCLSELREIRAEYRHTARLTLLPLLGVPPHTSDGLAHIHGYDEVLPRLPSTLQHLTLSRVSMRTAFQLAPYRLFCDYQSSFPQLRVLELRLRTEHTETIDWGLVAPQLRHLVLQMSPGESCHLCEAGLLQNYTRYPRHLAQGLPALARVHLVPHRAPPTARGSCFSTTVNGVLLTVHTHALKPRDLVDATAGDGRSAVPTLACDSLADLDTDTDTHTPVHQALTRDLLRDLDREIASGQPFAYGHECRDTVWLWSLPVFPCSSPVLSHAQLKRLYASMPEAERVPRAHKLCRKAEALANRVHNLKLHPTREMLGLNANYLRRKRGLPELDLTQNQPYRALWADFIGNLGGLNHVGWRDAVLRCCAYQLVQKLAPPGTVEFETAFEHVRTTTEALRRFFLVLEGVAHELCEDDLLVPQHIKIPIFEQQPGQPHVSAFALEYHANHDASLDVHDDGEEKDAPEPDEWSILIQPDAARISPLAGAAASGSAAATAPETANDGFVLDLLLRLAQQGWP